MRIVKKAVLYQNGWNNYGWAELPNWTPDTGTVLAGNAIEIREDQTAASFTARGEWQGCTDNTKKAPHAVRIMRVSDGHVVATSPSVIGGIDGFVNATATADVVAGEQYVMEFYSDSAQPGTAMPPRTGWFGSALGTYFQIS